MNITIAERLRPFSHLPGTQLMLPGTPYLFQIYPSFVVIFDLSGAYPRKIYELIPEIKGPVEKFTVMLDLEKFCLFVWGHSCEGYFRYRIHATADFHWYITMESIPSDGMRWNTPKNMLWVKKKETSDWILLKEKVFSKDIIAVEPLKEMDACIPIKTMSRLSLGNNKTQDWEMVRRRLDLTEILPVWLRLGQTVPFIEKEFSLAEGTTQLLLDCQNFITHRKKELISPTFLKLFNAGFQSILSPRLEDSDYQGLGLTPVSSENLSPLILLSCGADLIRSLFLFTNEEKTEILPALPPEFHCGRVLQEQIDDLAFVDFEWSKKTIRRMVIRALKSGTLNLSFSKSVKRLRLRNHKQDRGKVCSCPLLLAIEQGNTYLLDNFEK